MIEQDTYGGRRVTTSEWLLQDGESQTVRRTWRQRLFERPWRPRLKTRTIVPRIPYHGVIQIDEHTVLMHPETWRRLKKRIPEVKG